MNKLLVPLSIFISVLAVGTICDHFGVSANWKIGLLIMVAMLVQVVVSGYQRWQRSSKP